MKKWTLANCHQCGSNAVSVRYDALLERLPMMPVMPWIVMCHMCGARSFGNTIDNAVASWNAGHQCGMKNEKGERENGCSGKD